MDILYFTPCNRFVIVLHLYFKGIVKTLLFSIVLTESVPLSVLHLFCFVNINCRIVRHFKR